MNVALIVRRSVWNFPVALVMVTLFAWVFLAVKTLQRRGATAFFFAANVAGWLIWWRAVGNAEVVQVRRLPLLAIAACILVSLLLTLAWGHFMALNTDASAPYWDASVAMLSVMGQFLMAGRYLENWYCWITVNIISIGLY